MTTVGELLRDADPVRHEGPWTGRSRDQVRRALAGARRSAAPRRLTRLALAAAVAALALSAVAFGLLAPEPASAAAIRFEARLAERTPAPGLVPAPVAGSPAVVYLYPDPVAVNGDITSAQVIERNGTFAVGLTFSDDAARRLGAVTSRHLGRPIAILLDGAVVTAPTVRVTIAGVAIIDAPYSREMAMHIAAGVLGW
jgi:hypothetical protein